MQPGDLFDRALECFLQQSRRTHSRAARRGGVNSRAKNLTPMRKLLVWSRRGITLRAAHGQPPLFMSADKAPDFTTTGGRSAGKELKPILPEQLKKGPVVLYFFPRPSPAVVPPRRMHSASRSATSRGGRARDRHVGRRYQDATRLRPRSAAVPSPSPLHHTADPEGI